MWEKLLVFGVIFVLKGQCTDGQDCLDMNSHHFYVPGPNSCSVCFCEKGVPKWCKPVYCSQPANCKSFQRDNTCCDFKCLDDILDGNSSYKDTYDLALPLFASVVFAVIILSLLFFVVHRFRRRKLQERRNRRLSEDQRLNSIGYFAGGLRYLPGSIGYLRSNNNDMEFHYEETANHLSLWKPPGNYFPRGEAPPPYEEAVRSQTIESNHRSQLNSITVCINQNQNLCSGDQTSVLHQPPEISDNNNQLATNQQPRIEVVNHIEASNQPTSRNVDVPERAEILRRPEVVNRCETYENCKSQDPQERMPLVEHTQIEINSGERTPKHNPISTHRDKNLTTSKVEKPSKSSVFSLDKGKWCAYPEIKSSKHTVSEFKNAKDKMEATVSVISQDNLHPEKHNADRNTKYQNLMLKTLSQAIAKDKNATRTLERLNKLTQKCLEGNCYENIDMSVQRIRHRSIPAPLEFQNERNLLDKDITKSRDSVLNNSRRENPVPNENAVNYCKTYTDPKKPKEQIFVIDSKSAPSFLKDLKKSLEDCKESNTVKDPKNTPVFTISRSKEMLQEKDIPLHRTLPKNLKELIVDVKNNDSSLNVSCAKRSDNHLIHRSLPKHLNNCDISLPVNSKYPNSAKEENIKECPLLKSVDLLSNGAATVGNSHDKQYVKEAKQKDDHNLFPYQSLLSSQDDDDYRSECENCKAVDPPVADEESDVFNETMTLQRRPLETNEELPYYRTSLTLPTQIKKPRPTLQNSSRESWFMAMQMTSSEESD